MQVIRGFFLYFSFVMVAITPSWSQISTGTVNPEETKPDPKEKKEKKEKVFSEDSLLGNDFYIGGLFQYSYRTFEDQSSNGFYKEWEDQTSSYNGGFNAGVVMKLTKSIHLDIGFNYFATGENYTYADTASDSTFTYRNTYKQMALPVKLRYVYGDKWQVFGFAGLAPLNILTVVYESNYTTAEGVEVERDPDENKDGFATFNLMASAGLGFQYNVRHIGFVIYLEYRRHLLNTYSTKTISMNHKMYGIGINAALVLRF